MPGLDREAIGAEIDRHFRMLSDRYRPTKHSFFETLSSDATLALDSEVMTTFYYHYQTAIHATREMVYEIRPGIPRMRTIVASIINKATSHSSIARPAGAFSKTCAPARCTRRRRSRAPRSCPAW